MVITLFWHRWNRIRPVPGRNIIFSVLNAHQKLGFVRGYVAEGDKDLVDFEGRTWRYTVVKWKYID